MKNLLVSFTLFLFFLLVATETAFAQSSLPPNSSPLTQSLFGLILVVIVVVAIIAYFVKRKK